jgi:redox-sensitive bicupin YhaK (pirin superfamily)
MASYAENKNSAAPIKIHADSNVFAAILDAGSSLDFELAPERQAYLVLIEGNAALKGKTGSSAALSMRDAAEISGEGFSLSADKDPIHALLIEMARE